MNYRFKVGDIVKINNRCYFNKDIGKLVEIIDLYQDDRDNPLYDVRFPYEDKKSFVREYMVDPIPEELRRLDIQEAEQALKILDI
jgi:hypothetical protein